MFEETPLASDCRARVKQEDQFRRLFLASKQEMMEE